MHCFVLRKVWTDTNNVNVWCTVYCFAVYCLLFKWQYLLALEVSLDSLEICLSLGCHLYLKQSLPSRLINGKTTWLHVRCVTCIPPSSAYRKAQFNLHHRITDAHPFRSFISMSFHFECLIGFSIIHYYWLQFPLMLCILDIYEEL